MDHFEYRQNELFAEEVSLASIAAEVGTPCYVYSRATLERHFQAFDAPFNGLAHSICYAVKANGNIAVLQVLDQMGAGFDIVSGGELDRVIAAGGQPDRVVFSGVGKSIEEIRHALRRGVRALSVESEPELQRINEVAISLNLQASVAIRINPDVDPRTHPYIATGLRGDKFGVPFEDALALYQKASKMSGICLTGIACHIGSQLTEVAPFCDALQRVLDVVDELHTIGIHLTHLDLGGGLGIRYATENPPAPQQYIQALIDVLKTRECNMHVTLEPGRAIVGNAGVLLTKVEYIKKGPEKNFAIVDAAMNDLIRPALYEAWHDVVEVNKTLNRDSRKCDVVGPVCESGDFLARDRMLAIGQDDLVAVRSAGAYGFVMSSNYNARPRAAEVMVDGDAFHVIRERESTASLFSGEHLLR